MGLEPPAYAPVLVDLLKFQWKIGIFLIFTKLGWVKSKRQIILEFMEESPLKKKTQNNESLKVQVQTLNPLNLKSKITLHKICPRPWDWSRH